MKLRCLLPLLLLPFAARATAQTTLSLAEAVNLALREHPLLASSEQRIAASEGLRRQAGLVLNPRLVLQSENTRPYGNPSFVWPRDTDNFAYLQQTIETAGKRDRRVEVATAQVRRAQLERELLARQIAARVKQAYWAAAGARRVEQLLDENIRTFEQIVEYHENRVREGAMAEVDLIRVRLERERLVMALNAASLEAERARIQLFREMGRKEFPPVTLTDSLEPIPEGPAADIEQAIERRTEVKLARQAIEQARLGLRLQQSAAKPNVDVLFGYKRTSALDTMIAGVQVDLPFFNRNQGNVAAASAEIRAAESSLAAAEALVRAEIETALRDYEIRRRQLGETLQAMTRRASEVARIADAAYREGGTDLLRLLDAQRLRLEVQLLYVRALTEYRQSIAALEAALGAEP